VYIVDIYIDIHNIDHQSPRVDRQNLFEVPLNTSIESYEFIFAVISNMACTTLALHKTQVLFKTIIHEDGDVVSVRIAAGLANGIIDFARLN
jgi:hypothetical protein